MKIFKFLKNPNKVVREIHSEIDNAQDRLLQEARTIINQHSEDDKAPRLHAVGFTELPSVRAYIRAQNQAKEAMERAKLIEYYNVAYPTLKFITEEAMNEICRKYNLVFSNVSRYMRDVPEKNLRDIENAPALENMCLPVRSVMRDFFMPFRVRDWVRVDDEKLGLFIAAPKSHFNLKGLRKRGFGFFPEQKDPIVFRYCFGGIQIITKWGLEGEDPALLNEKMN